MTSSVERADHVRRRLPELVEIEALREQVLRLGPFASVETEAELEYGGHRLPIYSFALGTRDKSAPTIAYIGGVHGLERIGTTVAICHLKTVLELLQWDRSLQHLLEHCRLLFYPLVNPAGMYARTRSNPSGVDLMRNAPLDADGPLNVWLIGGHRHSPRLPWYRGALATPMEKEAEALCNFTRRELYPAQFALALDLHSGFGLVDRLWFPYAYSRRPFEHIGTMFELKQRLDKGLPNHFYQMEPQSLQYVTHGDLWDYLFLEQRQLHPERVFLPLALEMGSWIWVKKNPRQMLTPIGIFNPILPHRIQRTLRRHLALLDFLLRATASHGNWAPAAGQSQDLAATRAKALWYPGR